MTERYIYANRVGAGPEHPNKRWGLFSEELTVEQAAARYALDPGKQDEWFGVVLLEDGAERPRAYLEVCPRVNGVKLAKLEAHGSIEASYSWGAYHQSEHGRPYEGNDGRIFLRSIVWYVYPEGERFFRRNESIATVHMDFRPDGYGKEDRVTHHGFGKPSDIETREFRDVDMTANWFPIPEFGDWDALFHPEAEEGSGAA